MKGESAILLLLLLLFWESLNAEEDWLKTTRISAPANIRVEVSLCESTAISRKDVGKSARENLERYCGWFWVHCSSKKFAGMVHVAIPYVSDCWRKATIKFDNYSVRNSVLIIIPISSFGIVTCTFFPTTFLEIAAIKFSLKNRLLKGKKCIL